MRQTFDDVSIHEAARAWNSQDERHYPNHSDLGQIEPVACIAWIADEEVSVLAVADDVVKAESELLRCGNQVEKDVVERDICAILLHPDAS